MFLPFAALFSRGLRRLLNPLAVQDLGHFCSALRASIQQFVLVQARRVHCRDHVGFMHLNVAFGTKLHLRKYFVFGDHLDLQLECCERRTQRVEHELVLIGSTKEAQNVAGKIPHQHPVDLILIPSEAPGSDETVA